MKRVHSKAALFLSNNASQAEPRRAILCAETCADGAACPLQQATKECGGRAASEKSFSVEIKTRFSTKNSTAIF